MKYTIDWRAEGTITIEADNALAAAEAFDRLDLVGVYEGSDTSEFNQSLPKPVPAKG